MTTGYDCYQNALAERINGILKNEFLIYKCKNKQELDILIKESIEIYNNLRPHLALNMKTPNSVHNKKTCEVNFTGLNLFLLKSVNLFQDDSVNCFFQPLFPVQHTNVVQIF
jgi:hypothetical protein